MPFAVCVKGEGVCLVCGSKASNAALILVACRCSFVLCFVTQDLPGPGMP